MKLKQARSNKRLVQCLLWTFHRLYKDRDEIRGDLNLSDDAATQRLRTAFERTCDKVKMDWHRESFRELGEAFLWFYSHDHAWREIANDFLQELAVELPIITPYLVGERSEFWLVNLNEAAKTNPELRKEFVDDQKEFESWVKKELENRGVKT